MALPECLQRWRASFGLALFLCLALLGTEARASILTMQEARPVVASSAQASESTPMARDRMPCALCYVAPPPSTQGFSSECREPHEPAWWIDAAQVPTAALFDKEGDYARLPVRILHCRWLD